MVLDAGLRRWLRALRRLLVMPGKFCAAEVADFGLGRALRAQ
jgi:hypothetical protein